MWPLARYDEIADFYDASTGGVIDPATATLMNLVGDVAGKRILDLACGSGRVTRELARRGAAVIGLDISGELLEKARAAQEREPLTVTYMHADAASAATLEGRAFDGVVCNYGLSDIDDLDGALTTVERVLCSGGSFVFSILHPCFPGWHADAPSSWSPGGGYYREGWWLADNPGFRGKVGSNFRMLSTYLNALVSRGLAIEEVAEPQPPAEWAGLMPGKDPCRCSWSCGASSGRWASGNGC